VGVVDQVFPIDERTAQRAKEIVLERGGLSARAAVHAAVMELQGIEAILSFDTGFDDLPGIKRIG